MEAINQQMHRIEQLLSIDTNQIEKILSKPCSTHSGESSQFIHLNQSASDPRICMICILEKNIPMKDALSIREVLKTSKDSILRNYPVISVDPQLQYIWNSSVNFLPTMVTQIEKFFKSLKSSIIERIKKAQKAAKISLGQLNEFFDLTNSSLQQVSQIEELKQILQENDQGNIKLAEFIKIHCQNSQKNTEIVRENFMNFSKLKRSFSLEQPNQIMAKISNLLSTLSFFSENNSLPPLRIPLNPLFEPNDLNKNQEDFRLRVRNGFFPPRQPIPQGDILLSNRQQYQNQVFRNQDNNLKEAQQPDNFFANHFHLIRKQCQSKRFFNFPKYNKNNNYFGPPPPPPPPLLD